jgi:hypothetical protein
MELQELIKKWEKEADRMQLKAKTDVLWLEMREIYNLEAKSYQLRQCASELKQLKESEKADV